MTTYSSKHLQETDGTKTIKYYYGNGGVIGFNYNGTDYYYEKNLQGDITAIYNTSGVKQAEYVYDAWGKILSMTDSSGNDISNKRFQMSLRIHYQLNRSHILKVYHGMKFKKGELC